jgi:hypothetical protein
MHTNIQVGLIGIEIPILQFKTMYIPIPIRQIFAYSLLYFIQFVVSQDDLVLGRNVLHYTSLVVLTVTA